jgi:hypothetical protein
MNKNMNKGQVSMFSDAEVQKKMNIGKVFIFLSVLRTKEMNIDQLSMPMRKKGCLKNETAALIGLLF